MPEESKPLSSKEYDAIGRGYLKRSVHLKTFQQE